MYFVFGLLKFIFRLPKGISGILGFWNFASPALIYTVSVQRLNGKKTFCISQHPYLAFKCILCECANDIRATRTSSCHWPRTR